jgi:hypothetical protein
VERLILLLPAGAEKSTCQRIPYLNAELAQYEVFAYSAEDYAVRLDPQDYGNLDTKLEIFRQASPEAQSWADRLKDLPFVERLENNNGSISLRVHGIEFARTSGNEMLFGLQKRAAVRDWNIAEVEQLAVSWPRYDAPGWQAA